MKISDCKLSKKTQIKLLEFFVLEVTARSAANLLSLQVNTAALFYRKVREVIVHHLALEADEIFNESIELDESYFGGVRKGKRGRAAAGKTVVFGILKRGGKVYAQVVPDTQTRTLMPIIASKQIAPDSVVYTDSYRSYNALDVSRFQHYRINHSKLFGLGKNHINGVENFWSQAKRVLRKYNGIALEHFNLFLKECAFRFNFALSDSVWQSWAFGSDTAVVKRVYA